jgi:hypothetical protein
LISTFFTHSWVHPPGRQHPFFKSHAYVYELKKKDGDPGNVKKVVVGFRGTWLYPHRMYIQAWVLVGALSNEYSGYPGPQCGVLLRLSNLTWKNIINFINPANWLSNLCSNPASLYHIPLSVFCNCIITIFGPSNFGLGDLYYDLTLIRVPYRPGVMWKWYTYWGTLILQWTSWSRCSCIRRIAAGLIHRPNGRHDSRQEEDPLVHLGFWALWASPEGLAGYNEQGELWQDGNALEPQKRVRGGVLHRLLQEAEEAARNKHKMEIFVVGHSLGGAVS